MTEHRRYFSQMGEDFLLWQALEHGPRYYVDVGAFDGVHLSNSYSFELAGWQGMCVEAHPRFAELCARQRPNSTLVRAACVGPETGESVTFLSEPLGLLSGIRADLTEGMERRYRSRNMRFDGFEEIEVETTTLTRALLESGAPRRIGFVSIDVEGTEVDVVDGFDFDRFDCAVFVVEANTGDAEDALIRRMAEREYQPHRRVGQNTFFARDERIGRILSTTVIECDIEDALHPDGAGATHPGHRGRHVVDRP